MFVYFYVNPNFKEESEVIKKGITDEEVLKIYDIITKN